MKILPFFLLIISFNTFAVEYILNWEDSVRNKDSFNQRMLDNRCMYPELQNKLFKGKNGKYYDKYLQGKKIRIQNCKQEKTFSDKELSIKEWRKIKVTKGFILSNYIKESGCNEIFHKHIPHFRRKNNISKYKDLNVLDPGEEYLVQSCTVPKKNIVKKNTKLFEVAVGVENYDNTKEDYNSLLNLKIFPEDNLRYLITISPERAEGGVEYITPYLLGARVSYSKIKNGYDESYVKPDILLETSFKYIDFQLFYRLNNDDVFNENDSLGGTVILKYDEYRLNITRDPYLNHNIITFGFLF